MINRGRVGLLCAALESDLYEKGTARLHTILVADGIEKHLWCCLGVAGDVAFRFGLIVERSCQMDSDGWGREEIDGTLAVMSRKIQDWYGFEDGNPLLITPSGAVINASSWNDEGLRNPDGTRTSSILKDLAAGFRRTFLKEE